MNKRYNKTYRDIKTKPRKSSAKIASSFFGRSKRSKRIRSEERYADAVFFGRPHRSSKALALPSISRRTILAAGLIVLFGTWFGTMYFLPFFDLKIYRLSGLKNIKVDEITPIVNDYLNQKSLFIFKNKNFFTASENAIADKIKQNFYLQDLQITKIFPNRLAIDVTEKISSIIYDNGNEYVILDSNGTVVKNLKACTDECSAQEQLATSTPNLISNQLASVSSTVSASSTSIELTDSHRPKYDSFALEFLNTPVVYDNRHQSVVPGQAHVLSSSLIKSILEISSLAHKNEHFFNIEYFVYQGPGNGLKAITDKSYAVYFNPDADLATQFANTNVVLKDNKPTNYVDVRYDNRVFWK